LIERGITERKYEKGSEVLMWNQNLNTLNQIPAYGLLDQKDSL